MVRPFGPSPAESLLVCLTQKPCGSAASTWGLSMPQRREAGMSKDELVDGYREGTISRRAFMRGMVALGVTLGTSVVYASALAAPRAGPRAGGREYPPHGREYPTSGTPPGSDPPGGGHGRSPSNPSGDPPGSDPPGRGRGRPSERGGGRGRGRVATRRRGRAATRVRRVSSRRRR